MSHQSNQNKEFYTGHRSSDSALIKYRNNSNSIKAVDKSDNDHYFNINNQFEIQRINDMLQQVSNSFIRMDFCKKHD
jgi:hypothetical protein